MLYQNQMIETVLLAMIVVALLAVTAAHHLRLIVPEILTIFKEWTPMASASQVTNLFRPILFHYHPQFAWIRHQMIRTIHTSLYHPRWFS